MKFFERNRESTAAVDYVPRFRWRFLHIRFWPIWLGLGVLRLITIMPRRWRNYLGNWLGNRAYERNAKRREIIDINLRWCFPDMSELERAKLSRRYNRVMMRTLLDYGIMWWGRGKRLEKLIQIEGEEHIRDCLNEGKTVLILTAHSVGLDFGAQAISRRFSMGGLLKPLRNELLEYYLARGRARFGCKLYPRENGTRRVIKALKEGQISYYIPDEDLGLTQRTIFVPFFGVPQATLTALGRMARMAHAAVLPTMTYFDAETGKYRVVIDPPMQGFPGEDEETDALRQNAEVERMIRRAPEQYMWSFRLFQTRPNGEENPYPYG